MEQTRMKRPENLSVVPHFVCPPDRLWPELEAGEVRQIPPSVLGARSVDGLDCWIIRTYYELRLAGRPATISARIEPGRVNIVGARDFGRKQYRPDAFFAIPRLDAHEPKLANFVIYQNGLKGSGPTWDWVWHWGQPDIVRRDHTRGTRVETIVFKGADINLDSGFKSDAFRAALAQIDIKLQIDAIPIGGRDNQWGDYSGVDAVLAIRNMTRYDAQQKPASKLMNAWQAEVPALLGPEPAFRELRTSDLDYLEVRSPEDTIAALKRLRDQPKLYASIVKAGQQRRELYSDERLRSRWIELLDGSLAEAFDRWEKSSRLSKFRNATRSLLAEPKSKSEHSRRIIEGERLLS